MPGPELDALTAEVTRNKDVDDSAVALINGIAAQLTAVAGDKAATLALADSLRASSDNLAAAVSANTPAAP